MITDSPLRLLCDLYNIPILLYVSERGDCNKTDIYRDVARNKDMAKRIDALVEAGLMGVDEGSVRVRITLTPRGAEVVEGLRSLETLLASD